MDIRIANLEDAEHIAKVMLYANNRDHTWSMPRIYKYVQKDAHDILLAIKDEPVGYVGVKALFDDESVKEKLGDNLGNLCQVTWMGVLPEHQKQGVAKNLITKAEEWGKTQGKTGMWLGCRENLIEFYQHLGLNILGAYKEEDKNIRYIMGKNFK